MALIFKSVLWLDLLSVGVNVSLITFILLFVLHWIEWGQKLAEGEIVYYSTWPPSWESTGEGTFAEMEPWIPTGTELGIMITVTITTVVGIVFTCFQYGLGRSLKRIFEIGGTGFEGMSYLEILSWLENGDGPHAPVL
eukprot:GHVH01002076.1.p1 GENE.GHVH01002076.1~~GHVH01002076.1.p1  ORF type:complete len:138 (+),score=16.39 GHVH01002076.1:233-646(+)